MVEKSETMKSCQIMSSNSCRMTRLTPPIWQHLLSSSSLPRRQHSTVWSKIWYTTSQVNIKQRWKWKNVSGMCIMLGPGRYKCRLELSRTRTSWLERDGDKVHKNVPGDKSIKDQGQGLKVVLETSMIVPETSPDEDQRLVGTQVRLSPGLRSVVLLEFI